MLRHARVVDAIDRAHTRTPVCHTCGEPTRIVAGDGSLWLVCSSRDPRPQGALGLLRRLIPHEEQLVVEPLEPDRSDRARRSALRLV